MAGGGYSREDVRFHSDGFGAGRPAVNVKVYGSPWDANVWVEFRRENPDADPRFTPEWVEEFLSDERGSDVFQLVCESESEYLIGWAKGTDGAGDALFPDDRVELWHEGRSGGWIVVDGLPDVEEWDAVRLARWRRFERVAKEIAAGVPYQMLEHVYVNDFGWWAEEQKDGAVSNAELPLPEVFAGLEV